MSRSYYYYYYLLYFLSTKQKLDTPRFTYLLKCNHLDILLTFIFTIVTTIIFFCFKEYVFYNNSMFCFILLI